MARGRPDWLSLPEDITAAILSRVGAVEVFQNTQFVCRKWRQLVQSPQRRATLCKIIRLRASLHREGSIEWAQNVCRRLVDLGREHVESVSLQGFGNDDLLRHICESCPNLISLRLAACGAINNAFDRISDLEGLKELEVTGCYITAHSLLEIGNGCPGLESLRLNSRIRDLMVGHLIGEFMVLLDDDDDDDDDEDTTYDFEADVIGKAMPQLKHLQLVGNQLTDKGLGEILDGCKVLTSLDLRGCLHVNLEGELRARCDEMNSFRPPADSLSDDEYLEAVCGANGEDSDYDPDSTGDEESDEDA